jgi:flagellar basal-body rod protein FlgB
MWSPITSRIERYMDLLAARQKLVASNIANASTPGYKTQDFDFQFEFQSRVAAGAASNSAASTAGRGSDPLSRVNVYEAPGLQAANDGNNVSLDRESRLLMENALRFNAASQLWKSHLRQIRLAIQEGRNG